MFIIILKSFTTNNNHFHALGCLLSNCYQSSSYHIPSDQCHPVSNRSVVYKAANLHTLPHSSIQTDPPSMHSTTPRVIGLRFLSKQLFAPYTFAWDPSLGGDWWATIYHRQFDQAGRLAGWWSPVSPPIPRIIAHLNDPVKPPTTTCPEAGMAAKETQPSRGHSQQSFSRC